ncbi:MAG: DUF1178 family protein [Burkholderiales bacterium]|nr:MAG: DUF1178 family protein [Burkholderiales bacterium]
MKVFNLQCDHEHGFEGWFGSEDDFRRQRERGLLECPLCGSTTVRRVPAAPRLNLSAGGGERRAAQPDVEAAQAPSAAQVQDLWLRLARRIVASTEDVGERFAEEARRIHYKEVPERGIRGTATSEQARELTDEGIEVFAFPLPEAAKKPLQ